MSEEAQTGGDLVSVVVPIHNVEAYLDDCIASVLSQTHKNLHLVLIDDGSTDSSGAIADRHAARDTRVQVIHQRNSGVSAARNAGLRAARGNWVSFVDADDLLDPRFLEWMLACARDPAAVAAGGVADLIIGTRVMEHPEHRETRARIWSADSATTTARLLLPGIPVGCWNKLFRRSFLTDHEVTFVEDLVMGEGLTFVTYAAQRAQVCVFTDLALYFYRRDNTRSATSRLDVAKMKIALRAIEQISDSLLIRDRIVARAVEYHTWRTSFLALAAASGTEAEDTPFYTDSLRTVRRGRVRMMAVGGLSCRERLKSLAVALFPRAAAARLARRWDRRLDNS